ncbi:MAG: ABC transporter ATP-binding protein/permease, partial [Oscillospiraceae bacterium]|nr:ABC transporter ATP-binding protein/permease [Oscillospiraceae bacterium]
IDAVMAGAPRNEILLIIGLFTLGIALVAAAQKGFELAYNRPMQWKIDRRIRNDVNEKALFSDFKYYDNPEFFKKFNFAQEEFAWQSVWAVSLLPNILKDVLTSAAMVTLIAQAGPVLLGITLGFIALGGLVSIPTIKPEADWRVKINDVWRPMDYVTRMLRQKENAAELRSSGAGLKFLGTIDGVTQNFNSAYQTFRRKVMPFNIAQGFLTPVQAGCVLLYILLFVIQGDTSKIGLYASLTAASATLAQNLGWIAENVKDILQLSLNGERIAAFFEAKSEIEPPREGAMDPPEGVYDIELRDVSFGYEKAAFGIEHLNLHIEPGQRVAIVGENGAGKTTLTKLLLRLYDTNGGQVLVNGVDIREYDVHKLRLHIGVAFQDVRVLAMSLRDNLTVYHDMPDEGLLEVIHRLGLESVLEKAGGNLDTMVSREFTEDGAALSGGEAQRLTLARLFTGPFGLLVLDEPSSALDPLAEYNLMRIILDASNTATTIMIAHRLSTVRDFDIIYHMENGAILESGTHDELMAAKGKYCEMFTRQAENYQEGEAP